MQQNRKICLPLTDNQKVMIRRRGLDPNNYWLLKNTCTSLYLLDRRNGRVKIIYKLN